MKIYSKDLEWQEFGFFGRAGKSAPLKIYGKDCKITNYEGGNWFYLFGLNTSIASITAPNLQALLKTLNNRLEKLGDKFLLD